MTASKHLPGASSARLSWDSIDWPHVEKTVKRLQMRIAKATREGRHGKAKALQWLLTHSRHAKLLAVKRVTQNRGAKTPGTDGVAWKTPQKKMHAVLSLRRHGYRPQPLRRIYIPKKNGEKRPLSIPTMTCRAQQALHLLGLEPVAETLADPNSYGFRPKRAAIDAIEQAFCSLARPERAKWILEGDIKSCFDRISHDWLLRHIPMDKVILQRWLKAGYLEQGSLYETKAGTPQGGIISPVLLVLTLRGLEKAVRTSVRDRIDRVNVIVYADDFIVTGATREVLEHTVKPVISSFLGERGLALSEEKTKITHIDDGFDFLGFSIRKYNGTLLIKPAKTSINSSLKRIRAVIKANATTKTEVLLEILNPKIRGWGMYYRNVVAKRVFSKIDNRIFAALWEWALRRHPNKGRRWIARKYFRSVGPRNWVFSSGPRSDQRDIVLMAKIVIRRHVKIRSEATPYDPRFNDYFVERAKRRWVREVVREDLPCF